MSRSYRLLCPIARSLDRVGDRWTLLMLRDLHAGPMRFGDFLSGLPGAASNLVASRLQKLKDDGLVEQRGQLYTLTNLGLRTERVLWELARLGGHFPPDDDLKRPGHLRLVAVTLQNALRHVGAQADLIAELILDGESFTIDLAAAPGPTVRYGAPDAPHVIATSSYEPMMAAASGALSIDAFRAAHVQLEGTDESAQRFAEIMGRVVTEGFRDPP